MAGMRQFYVAYEDREDEIIQSGIGRFGQTFEIIQSGSDLKSAVIEKIQKFLLELGKMQMYVNYFDRYKGLRMKIQRLVFYFASRVMRLL